MILMTKHATPAGERLQLEIHLDTFSLKQIS
nr:hypothetical protein [uncultured bacterium]